MIAFKFLLPGGRGRFSGLVWPTPENGTAGRWVEGGTPDPGRRGVHASRAEHLPVWALPELWQIELDGDMRELRTVLVAERGRLLSRVDAWHDDAIDAFIAECRSTAVTLVGDAPRLEPITLGMGHAARTRDAALAGFCAARAAEEAGGRPAWEAERSRQAGWFRSTLSL